MVYVISLGRDISVLYHLLFTINFVQKSIGKIFCIYVHNVMPTCTCIKVSVDGAMVKSSELFTDEESLTELKVILILFACTYVCMYMGKFCTVHNGGEICVE